MKVLLLIVMFVTITQGAKISSDTVVAKTKAYVGAGSTADFTVQKANSGSYSAFFYNTNTGAGNRNGLLLRAGNSTSDAAMRVISSGGNALMYLRGDGNIGIGTESATNKLVIKTTSGGDGLRLNGPSNIFSGEISAEADGDGYLYLRNGSNDNKILLYANGDSYLNGGNVGIGTSSPIAKLDVRSSIAAFGSNAGDFYSYGNTLNFGHHANITYEGWINYVGYNHDATQTRSLRIGNGKGSTIALFDTLGNVTIGGYDFGSPVTDDKLSIYNTANVYTNLMTGDESYGAYTRYHNDYDGLLWSAGMAPASGSHVTPYVIRREQNAYGEGVVGTHLYIHPNGNVGMGNEAPEAKLHVNGSVRADSVESATVVHVIKAITLADDAIYDLPAKLSHGSVNMSGRAIMFFSGADGTTNVNLLGSNVDNYDADGKLCVFDNGANAVIKNRLGSQQTFLLTYYYVK